MTIDDRSLLPMPQIREAIANQIAQDLMTGWLRESVDIPVNMMEVVQQDLTPGRITAPALLSDLLGTPDRSHLDAISSWINELRHRVSHHHQLECTQQGVNLLGPEQGKILQFLTQIKPEIDRYHTEQFHEPNFDEQQHGHFFRTLYSKRDPRIQQGREFLTAQVTRMISHPQQGPKFAEVWIRTTSKFLNDITRILRHDRDNVWRPNQRQCECQYESALAQIGNLQDKFSVCKEAQMEEYWEDATNGLQGMMIATLQIKARFVALSVIVRLQEHLLLLEARLHRYRQCLQQSRKIFQDAAQQASYHAEILALQDNPRFDRQDLNTQYLETYQGVGQDLFYQRLTEQILKHTHNLVAHPIDRPAIMQPFDITEILASQEPQFRSLILKVIGTTLIATDRFPLRPKIQPQIDRPQEAIPTVQG
jgi:hypothetical protein